MTMLMDRDTNYHGFFFQSSRLTMQLPVPAADSRLDVSLWLSYRRTFSAPAWPLLPPPPIQPNRSASIGCCTPSGPTSNQIWSRSRKPLRRYCKAHAEHCSS